MRARGLPSPPTSSQYWVLGSYSSSVMWEGESHEHPGALVPPRSLEGTASAKADWQLFNQVGKRDSWLCIGQQHGWHSLQ